MGLGSVIKKIARPVGAVAKAVGQGVQQAVEPPAPSPMDVRLAEYAPPEYQPMQLPEIAADDPDREQKQAVHDMIRELEAGHAEHAKAQGQDYHDQYQKLAEYAGSRPQERQFDPVSAFMIGLGSDKGLEAVKEHNAGATKDQHDREEYLLGLKEQALKGNIQQLMEEGKFKQVLTQSAALEQLHATQDRLNAAREQTNKIAQIEAGNAGKVAVAHIRASAAIQNAEKRLAVMQLHYGISKAKMASLDKQYGTKYRAYMEGHKDPLGQFDGDVDVANGLWQDWHDAVENEGENVSSDETRAAAAAAEAAKAKAAAGGQTGAAPTIKAGGAPAESTNNNLVPMIVPDGQGGEMIRLARPEEVAAWEQHGARRQ